MKRTKERVIPFLQRLDLWGFASGVSRRLRQAKRSLTGVERTLCKAYFAGSEIKKLHIGCGENLLDSWLNSDLYPHSSRILHLDATKKFPFPDGTFDYIFSEHMIEHISHPDGLLMLAECHRVLKNNGKIRISTPNLQFLIDLYRDEKSELQKAYIIRAASRFLPSVSHGDAVHVINHFFRAWGHLFIYDEKTLRSSLETAGFARIIRCELNESEDASLRNLETEKRMPPGLLKLETITLEGIKDAVN